MASLLGKADSTLISAARSEAMADVPANLSSVYKRRAKNFDSFLDMVNEAFDKQTKADKEREKREKELSEKSVAASAVGVANEHHTNALAGAVKNLSDEAKKHETGSLEYKKWENEMMVLNADTETSLDDWTEMQNTKMSTKGTGPELDLWMQMQDDHVNGTNKSNIEYRDGKYGKGMYYTLQSDSGGEKVSMTMAEIKRRIKKVDPAGPTSVMEVFNGVGLNANKRKWDDVNYQTDVFNDLERTMETPNDKHNIMRYKFPGMKYSIYDALNGKDPELLKEVYETLEEYGLDIDSADNVFTIARTIEESSDGNAIIARILTDTVGEDVYLQGENKRNVGDDGIDISLIGKTDK